MPSTRSSPWRRRHSARPPFPGAVFDTQAHRWKRGGAAEDAASAGARDSAPGDDGAAAESHLPARVRSKFRQLLAAAASLPAAVKDKAAGVVSKTYAKLTAKYGPTGAKLVLGGMIALMPVPLPGTSVLPLALAEGVRRLGGLLRGGGAKRAGEAEGMPEESSGGTADLDADTLAAAIREALAEVCEGLGGKAPGIEDEDLKEVAAGLLKGGESE